LLPRCSQRMLSRASQRPTRASRTCRQGSAIPRTARTGDGRTRPRASVPRNKQATSARPDKQATIVQPSAHRNQTGRAAHLTIIVQHAKTSV
jgi:hypothetical protein